MGAVLPARHKNVRLPPDSVAAQGGYGLWLRADERNGAERAKPDHVFSTNWSIESVGKVSFPGSFGNRRAAFAVSLHVVRKGYRPVDLCRPDRARRRALQSGPRQYERRTPRRGEQEVRGRRQAASLFRIRPQIDGDGRLRQLPAGQL